MEEATGDSRVIPLNLITSVKKRDAYHFRDEGNSMIGPFDIKTLHLWHFNRLISDNTLIYDSTLTESTPLIDLLKQNNLCDKLPDETKSEWFLWTDSKTPYISFNTRLSKAFISHRPKNDFKLLSIVNEKLQIMLNNFQDFEDFLDQYTVCPDDVRAMHLNDFAQPFAAWVLKTFTNLNIPVTPDEVKNLLLESDIEVARKFFFEKIQTEKEAHKVWNSYNQWRMFIPVHTVSE